MSFIPAPANAAEEKDKTPGEDGRVSRRRLSPARALRRALALMVATIVWPGSAQLLAGRRRLGLIVMALWGVLVIAAIVVLLWFRPERETIFGWVTDAETLYIARLVVVGVVLGWLALFVDAWRLATFPGLDRPRWLLVAVLNMTVIALVSGMLTIGWSTVSASRQVVTEVFAATETAPPLQGRYNILLIGADSADGREGLRPDSLNVLSVDARTADTVMVSLPRNLQGVPFPEDSPMHALYPNGFNCGSECLLNAVHTAAQERADLYPDSDDPGLDATIEAVEGATGLSINYYVMINMQGFASLVDAVGGVTVTVTTPIAMFGETDRRRDQFIPEGRQRLDGNEALWFARSRIQSDDFTRMARQKCLMVAMLDQLSPQTVLLNAGRIADSSSQMLRTDLPASELAAFADLALDARTQQIATLSVVPPEYNTVNPDFARIHADIAALIARSSQPASSASPSAPAPTTAPGPTTAPQPTEPTATPDANITDDLAAAC
ncbi:LytR family transcriptional regulator [Aeromicrobium phragmitis]|uniref:LytR family transcriptional regulator n=1 Tax=Aeromicrobium phragmitis TaxID=2478914 RepID=A0A3L8PHD0_9ACTN|nr:LCP family protein [Aeromicrobium phragmitis]RLV54637.1 LytR family transcriptional regulator [Aeromicrobium phragmitis]